MLVSPRNYSLLLQNIENNNNDIKWKRTPPLSRSKTLPDLLYQDQDGPVPTFNKGLFLGLSQLTFEIDNVSACHLDSPAPCKIFPKAPKIALTIDDVPSEFQRRKSSGSSVNSNTSAIEPHIYDFQESERGAESSLIIRFVPQLYSNSWRLIQFLFAGFHRTAQILTSHQWIAIFRRSFSIQATALSTASHVC